MCVPYDVLLFTCSLSKISLRCSRPRLFRNWLIFMSSIATMGGKNPADSIKQILLNKTSPIFPISTFFWLTTFYKTDQCSIWRLQHTYFPLPCDQCLWLHLLPRRTRWRQQQPAHWGARRGCLCCWQLTDKTAWRQGRWQRRWPLLPEAWSSWAGHPVAWRPSAGLGYHRPTGIYKENKLEILQEEGTVRGFQWANV